MMKARIDQYDMLRVTAETPDDEEALNQFYLRLHKHGVSFITMSQSPKQTQVCIEAAPSKKPKPRKGGRKR